MALVCEPFLCLIRFFHAGSIKNGCKGSVVKLWRDCVDWNKKTSEVFWASEVCGGDVFYSASFCSSTSTTGAGSVTGAGADVALLNESRHPLRLTKV